MLNRRIFMQKLGILFSFSTLGIYAKNSNQKNKKIKLTTLKVAGLQYGECTDEIFHLNETLYYKREAENKYDQYAVAIYRNNKKVGYIPKENSRIIASLMDSREKIEIRVRYFDASKAPWERLWVSLYKIG